MKNSFLGLLLILFCVPKQLIAQESIFSQQEIYTNTFLVDTLFKPGEPPLTDTFIISTNQNLLQKHINHNSYYDWTKYEPGYSISYVFKNEGYWQSVIMFFRIQTMDLAVLNEKCIAFKLDDKLYIFQLIKEEGDEYDKIYYYTRI